MKPRIAVVIPTIREEQLKDFLKAWKEEFDFWGVKVVIVHDGDEPFVEFEDSNYSIVEIMGEKDADLIYNKSDCCRNLGFAFVAKELAGVEYILTLDDDMKPNDSTINDHLNILGEKVSISWVNTAGDDYMRGFPYKVREEAEVKLSHGVWYGVADWDAPTQLVNGNKDVEFYKGIIPKGVYYPMCGMNIMFHRDLLPYMYYAPMGHRVGMDRFADIWLGVVSKRIIDKKGWAVATGYSSVIHDSLEKLAKGSKGAGT
jgi:reversibly glycosylated polypeptide/UDP-arabinopyranose mutase